jgi:hypothetical protein
MAYVRSGSLLSGRYNTHAVSAQLNRPWCHPVFCYIMCPREIQRDSYGVSRYVLSSTNENNFNLDSEGGFRYIQFNRVEKA